MAKRKVLTPFPGKFVARVQKPRESKSDAGLILPETTQRYRDEAEVIAVGSSYLDGSGVRREPPTGLTDGVFVMVNPHWGRLWEDEGATELRVYSFSDPYGVIDEEDEP